MLSLVLLVGDQSLMHELHESWHVSVGSTWKMYKNFPIDGATASGVKKWPLSSVRLKYSNITAN